MHPRIQSVQIPSRNPLTLLNPIARIATLDIIPPLTLARRTRLRRLRNITRALRRRNRYTHQYYSISCRTKLLTDAVPLPSIQGPAVRSDRRIPLDEILAAESIAKLIRNSVASIA